MRQYKFKKIHKIDFKNDYPCPCRRNGSLKPIFLTEALGCDRCQQIFVVQDNHQVIEQLSSVYQKRAWRWNGHRWINIYPGLNPNSLSLLFIAIVLSPIILAIVLPLILHRFSAPSMILWVILSIVLIVLVALLLWLAYRT